MLRYFILALCFAFWSCEKVEVAQEGDLQEVSRSVALINYTEVLRMIDDLSLSDAAYFDAHWPKLRGDILHTIQTKGIDYYSYEERRNIHWSLLFIFEGLNTEDIPVKHGKSLNDVLKLFEFKDVNESMDTAIEIRKTSVELYGLDDK